MRAWARARAHARKRHIFPVAERYHFAVCMRMCACLFVYLYVYQRFYLKLPNFISHYSLRTTLLRFPFATHSILPRQRFKEPFNPITVATTMPHYACIKIMISGNDQKIIYQRLWGWFYVRSIHMTVCVRVRACMRALRTYVSLYCMYASMLFGCTIQFFYLSAIAYIKKLIKYPWIEIACARILMLTGDRIFSAIYEHIRTYTSICSEIRIKWDLENLNWFILWAENWEAQHS